MNNFHVIDFFSRHLSVMQGCTKTQWDWTGWSVKSLVPVLLMIDFSMLMQLL